MFKVHLGSNYWHHLSDDRSRDDWGRIQSDRAWSTMLSFKKVTLPHSQAIRIHSKHCKCQLNQKCLLNVKLQWYIFYRAHNITRLQTTGLCYNQVNIFHGKKTFWTYNQIATKKILFWLLPVLPAGIDPVSRWTCFNYWRIWDWFKMFTQVINNYALRNIQVSWICLISTWKF